MSDENEASPPEQQAPEADPSAGRGRKLGAFAVGLVALTVLLVVFAGRGRKPPLLPDDLYHRASLSSRRPADTCLGCHSRSQPVEGAPPQSSGHTGRQDCESCHQLGTAEP